MGHWRTRTKDWVSNEHLDHRCAEDAFVYVFAALPTIAPSEDFVRRTVQTAWSARARRRAVARRVAIAASLLTATAAGVLAYGLTTVASGWPVATIATVAASSTVSLLMATAASIEWWAATARASGQFASILSMPQTAVWLLALEFVGGTALYALHRLLRAEPVVRGPGPLCL